VRRCSGPPAPATSRARKRALYPAPGVPTFRPWHSEPVAAVCHGPQLLMAAHLVKGRTLTAWPTVQDDLRLAGAQVRDEPVVKDRNWITSRKPDDLEQFSTAIVEALRR
jgi:putative intracellular protease/amidase